MEAKDVVKVAVQYVSDIFAHEKPTNIGLEEITFDEENNIWNVTIGFSRPWDYESPNILTGLQPKTPNRQYKVVRIDDNNGKVKEITMRETGNG
jgi:hypothetical protein